MFLMSDLGALETGQSCIEREIFDAERILGFSLPQGLRDACLSVNGFTGPSDARQADDESVQLFVDLLRGMALRKLMEGHGAYRRWSGRPGCWDCCLLSSPYSEACAYSCHQLSACCNQILSADFSITALRNLLSFPDENLGIHDDLARKNSCGGVGIRPS
ncbi:hypothetical protein HWE04_05050 [Herbaspirillum sp. C7C2]|uniref:hypothetical protein n=1 Tax=Herbaspirillum sp. C7C2 TaxID=2736666 RepID=UPI001F5227E7|nr:hypothetical protein [Herbaspirillum sp. C7C2]MCI1013208.1 hypothetical protein [Herbaspirillum sp. C7C2]